MVRWSFPVAGQCVSASTVGSSDRWVTVVQADGWLAQVGARGRVDAGAKRVEVARVVFEREAAAHEIPRGVTVGATYVRGCTPLTWPGAFASRASVDMLWTGRATRQGLAQRLVARWAVRGTGLGHRG